MPSQEALGVGAGAAAKIRLWADPPVSLGSMQRIVLVSPKPPPTGGIARWTEIVLAEASRRADISIDHIDTAPRWRSIHHTGVPRRLLGGAVQGARDAITLKASLRTPAVAVAVTTSGHLAALRDNLVILLARQRHVATYLHVRMGRIPKIVETNGWEWRLLSRAMKLATGVVVLDVASERALRSRLPGVRVQRIPNCVAIPNRWHVSHSKGSEELEIVYVGWVVPAKGLAELVRAWTETAYRSRLTLVGPGDPAFVESLRRIAAASGRAQYLGFTGNLAHERAVERIATADIFVLPSYSEGFPNAIAEAMAAERAIVATTVGAIPEMLTQDSTAPCGVLVPPREAASLRQALDLLLGDAVLRATLGTRARMKAEEEYSTGQVFDRLLKLWLGGLAEGLRA